MDTTSKTSKVSKLPTKLRSSAINPSKQDRSACDAITVIIRSLGRPEDLGLGGIKAFQEDLKNAKLLKAKKIENTWNSSRLKVGGGGLGIVEYISTKTESQTRTSVQMPSKIKNFFSMILA